MTTESGVSVGDVTEHSEVTSDVVCRWIAAASGPAHEMGHLGRLGPWDASGWAHAVRAHAHEEDARQGVAR